MGHLSKVHRDQKRMKLEDLFIRDCLAILNAFLATKVENNSSLTSLGR